MGQGTAEIKKLESRERSKIVNFANIKLWISDNPANVEPPSIQETENTEKQKKEFKQKINERIPEFQRTTCSKTADQSNKVKIAFGNPAKKSRSGKYFVWQHKECY